MPKKLRTIITPDQFDQLYAALAAEPARLMAEVLIESGLRGAELIELRPVDLNPRRSIAPPVTTSDESTMHAGLQTTAD